MVFFRKRFQTFAAHCGHFLKSIVVVPTVDVVEIEMLVFDVLLIS
jgi:hypothetical protein